MDQSQLIIFAKIIIWASWLVFPFLILLYYFRHKLPRLLLILLVTLSLLFVWSRFIETKIIMVNETKIEADFDTSIALIADTHLGVYKDSKFLERVVKIINEQSVDYVLIAGDFTYATKPNDLEKLFTAFGEIKKPTYAVLGNHDVDELVQPIRSDIVTVLNNNNIQILNNESLSLDKFTLVALGDAWTNEDKVSLLENLSEDDNVIVLTHNPDTITKYKNKNADFTLTGHTHCGQIRLPLIYKYIIPTEGDFDKGFSVEEKTKLFITCGLGEVTLPMRIFNPPVIDILKFTTE